MLENYVGQTIRTKSLLNTVSGKENMTINTVPGYLDLCELASDNSAEFAQWGLKTNEKVR